MTWQHLDWINDNGIALRIIEDAERNRFYDSVLSTVAPAQRIIDVGFGTGLLSILAIKHGATAITAYESDVNRYELGQVLIRHLGMDQQIQLIHDRFDARACDLSQHDLIMHEILDGVLYGEGMSCTFNHHLPVCPARYRTEIRAYSLTQQQAKLFDVVSNGLGHFGAEFDLHHLTRSELVSRYQALGLGDHSSLRHHKDFLQLDNTTRSKLLQGTLEPSHHRGFDPGVEISCHYREFISQQIMRHLQHRSHSDIWAMTSRIVDEFDSDQLAIIDQPRSQGTCVACLDLDLSKPSVGDIPRVIETTVTGLAPGYWLLMPFFTFAHGDREMKIEDGHWRRRKAWAESAVVSGSADLQIRQDITNGHITYTRGH